MYFTGAMRYAYCTLQKPSSGHAVPTRQFNIWWATGCPPYEFLFWILVFAFLSPVRRRVAEAAQGILTNMFEHVAA